MADRNPSVPGAILITIGIIMLAFVFIANALAIPTNPVLRLLEEFLFLPIILIFAGRALQRRARRAAKPAPEPVRRPTTQQQRTQEHRRQQQQSPQVGRAPERAPRTEPDRTLEEILLGESEAVPIPPPPRPGSSPSRDAVRRGTDLAGSRTGQADPGSFHPKSSAEMVAEAKRRLRRET